ncbi:MAG: DUF6434 domain-containing protein [Calditrichota bacterium]
MDKRPRLDIDISETDFKEFYWLKEELVAFCRSVGISTSGSKTELENRIIQFLHNGDIATPKRKKKPLSAFDWRNEPLSRETIITDSYKNNQNVRQFFTKQIGKRFRFNIAFMDWMKVNIGKNLGNAVDAWLDIEEQQKTRSEPKKILPHLQYNRYIRDFLADNPDKSMQDAITYWKIKKSKRGDNLYRREDLDSI